MNAPMKKNGFTLVETMVTGVLLTVFSVGILTFFRMHNLEAGTSSANFNLQANANVVREQLSRDVRNANRILAPGETWTQTITVMDTVNEDEVHLYDNSGTIFAAYRLHDGFLHEAHFSSPVSTVEADDFEVFSIGPQQVAASDSSYFFLTPARQLLVLNAELTIDKNSISQSMQLAGTAYRCRN